MTKKIISFTALLFAVVALSASCGSNGNDAESVAGKFTSAWAKGDLETAIEFADDSYREGVSRSIKYMKADGEYEQYTKSIKDKDWKFKKEKMENRNENVIEINYTAKGAKTTSTSAIILKKNDDGKWQVNYFQMPK